MMTKIEIVEIPDSAGNMTQSIVIDNGDGTFTSMLKSTWDELEAAKENGTIS
jgi:DNA/RNA endonuclease YhcR with UshA esterase domain